MFAEIPQNPYSKGTTGKTKVLKYAVGTIKISAAIGIPCSKRWSVMA